ncbi:glutaredoxin family protein [Ramlibacter alkalitolerans]|uniref:Glutaredoxin family protein n=1 Tax=Ramlibacter alkalitolerans TaxID=2039631 RepID=A0ABS1JLQ4_9BURK|nr:glutaredoxin family protein [Ramlibacter alkalitolerans]MBL0425152.1 glutaredoxin family protein [Ramlibacter alkalitolerans]
MSSVRLAALAAALACASLWGTAAHAQVYRIVGPDGRVTFSDRPPPDANATPAPSLPLPASTGSAATATLPFELRNAATRFPVTLYTGKECGPCEAARSFLANRGIPFTEKTVSTDADARAVRNLSGANSLPFATVGGQHLVGFSDSEWAQYMDAAGYPRTSQLPPGYRNAPATPVVAVEPVRRAEPAAAAQAPAPARAQAPQAPLPLPSDPSPSNPLGLRF